MARLTRNFSAETKELLQELAEENQLSVVKRKGLVDHFLKAQQPLQRSHSENGHETACGPRQRPFLRRQRTHLDSVTSLRKKEAIQKSGAYIRDDIAPPKGKEMSDREKEKLAHQMAYRCAPPDLPGLDELLRSRRNKKIDIEITPRSRQSELMKEIDERMEFLDEMQSLGSHYIRKYEGTVQTEIALKAHELEQLKLQSEVTSD